MATSIAAPLFDLVERLSLEIEHEPTSDAMVELCVLSFLAFLTLYGMTHAFSTMFIPFYRKLSYADQTDWCTRSSSVTHALIMAHAGYQVVVNGHGSLLDNPFHGYSTFAKIYSCIAVGYFLSDLLVIVRHFHNFGTPALNTQFVLHHVFGAVGYMICVSYSMFFYFGMFRLMSEASTPFIAVHATLESDEKLRKSKWLLINDTALFLMFLVVRICALPVYWHVAVSCWNDFNAPLWLKIAFCVFSLVGDSLNVMWFYGMIKTAPWAKIWGIVTGVVSSSRITSKET